jgi:hypothetical protein
MTGLSFLDSLPPWAAWLLFSLVLIAWLSGLAYAIFSSPPARSRQR